jgi:hypothetical protein
MEDGGNRPGGLQRKAGALVAGVVDWVCRRVRRRDAGPPARAVGAQRRGWGCWAKHMRAQGRRSRYMPPATLRCAALAPCRAAGAAAHAAARRPGGALHARAPAPSDTARVFPCARSVPGTIFESDRDAERAGVYRRSHAAKFYDSDAERLVQRAVAPEFATTGATGPPAASAERPDFTVKVVNGVPQVVARGPADADAAALEAAAMRSDSLLVKPIKAQLQGGEAGAGEIQPQLIGGNAEQTGRRKQAGGK